MKRQDQSRLAFALVIILAVYIGVIAYFRERERMRRIKRTQQPINIHIPQQPVNTLPPEFRKPPIKKYKPGHVQQMGILSSPGGETIPLYGKEVRGRRDRYHYYTSTTGEQIYSIPVFRDGRDCMEDIGCQELYDNDQVTLLGGTSPHNVKLYRTDNFF